jgi:predicted DNA-binding transcriptional regulator
MSKDQGLGAVLLIASVVGIILYGWLVFLSDWSVVVLQATGFIAVAGVLGIVAWIGYTLATTPPPPPLEDLGEEQVVEEAEAVG